MHNPARSGLIPCLSGPINVLTPLPCWAPLRCFPEWALSTHFTDKESEAQRGEETAPCNFSAASQLLSKVGGYGEMRGSWAGSGKGGQKHLPLQNSHTHSRTHARTLVLPLAGIQARK